LSTSLSNEPLGEARVNNQLSERGARENVNIWVCDAVIRNAIAGVTDEEVFVVLGHFLELGDALLEQ